MSVFVLISGGWSGGWAWRPVALRLRQAGHDVHTPTLTGLAERAHVRTAEPTTFSTHVQDVLQLLYFEELTDVILVGWSYGGAVIDGVADLVPERVAHVVNLDGEVVQEGKLLSDGWTEQERKQFQDGLEEASRTGWITAPTSLIPPVARTPHDGCCSGYGTNRSGRIPSPTQTMAHADTPFDTATRDAAPGTGKNPSSLRSAPTVTGSSGKSSTSTI